MLNKVGIGDSSPEQINVIIEIPSHSDPIKYEVDHDTGAMVVDRFMTTAMHYPCEYGYVPGTLSEDGDPLDVLVLSPLPIITGAVISVRPIGMLDMIDEAGKDYKLLAVPCDKLTAMYSHVHEPSDLPEFTLKQIAHFFQHYKDLDPNKWVKIAGWLGAKQAKQVIIDAIKRGQEADGNI